jgi:16S rRNA A1518/A1519 N6-dimethyltransferase RsmA/KsgA/DIM1 with predicted DNA glycosylase/AP lyase activity
MELRLMRHFVDPAGKRILEIGSGDGRLTREYARLAKEVVAIEQDRAGVAIARREFASEGIEPRSDQPHQGCDQRHADQGRLEAA